MELLLLKLLDLAILGEEHLMRAKVGRDKIKAMMARGGPTPDELAALERESDLALAVAQERLRDE